MSRNFVVLDKSIDEIVYIYEYKKCEYINEEFHYRRGRLLPVSPMF